MLLRIYAYVENFYSEIAALFWMGVAGTLAAILLIWLFDPPEPQRAQAFFLGFVSMAVCALCASALTIRAIHKRKIEKS
jgi:hypothetical protein